MTNLIPGQMDTPLALDFRGQYLTSASAPLFRRTYDAIGFFSQLEHVGRDPWRFLADPNKYVWTWLLGYGAFTGGIAGVIIADYWAVRKQNLKLHDIYIAEGYYKFAEDKVNWMAAAYGLFLVVCTIVLWQQKAILGEGWPSTLTTLVLVLGLLAGIYFYVSKIKGVNFAGVLALFSGVVGSLVLAKVSAALAQWTWFTGAIIGYIAYVVLYNAWYGKHHPAVPK
jgi:cytosine/uracil/thiamine/allantoin permease